MIRKIFATIIMIAAGIALIIFSGKSKARLSDPTYTKVEATIVDIEIDRVGDSKTTDVYVEFELNGEKITAQLDTYRSSMRIGNTEEVLVDPGNPTSVYSASPSNAKVLLILGIVFIAFGLFVPFSKGRGRVRIG